MWPFVVHIVHNYVWVSCIPVSFRINWKYALSVVMLARTSNRLSPQQTNGCCQLFGKAWQAVFQPSNRWWAPLFLLLTQLLYCFSTVPQFCSYGSFWIKQATTAHEQGIKKSNSKAWVQACQWFTGIIVYTCLPYLYTTFKRRDSKLSLNLNTVELLHTIT